MSISDLLAKKFLGDGVANTATQEGAPTNGIPPFAANLLRQFGITPESIQLYAETIKTAIEQMRDDLAECKARIQAQDAKLEEIANMIHQKNGDTDPAGSTANMTPAPDLKPIDWSVDSDETIRLGKTYANNINTYVDKIPQ